MNPPNYAKIDIALVNAVAYQRACQLPGSQSFSITLSNGKTSARSALASAEKPIDLPGIPEEYHDFANVFSKVKANQLPPHRPYDLKINIKEGSTPPLSPIYSLSKTKLEALREFLDKNIANGFIQPTHSPYGAPILFVKKKGGTLCLCVNFCGLNKLMKKDRYPIPLTSDLLDSLKNACIYTKINLRHAYHLVRISEGDEWKTVFRTRYGSFEWLVMPFGLSNGPAAFQRFMNDIFADMLDVCVVVYLDDILIYSDNMDIHKTHVREVLKRLRENGLYAGVDKCEFHSESIEYLGFRLSPKGLSMDPAKIQTIQDWPEPRKVNDIQKFLGFANFYHRFIDNYSDIVIPLTCLTRKSNKWNFNDKCRNTFNTLKSAFLLAPIFTHWIPDRQITLETAAPDYA